MKVKTSYQKFWKIIGIFAISLTLLGKNAEQPYVYSVKATTKKTEMKMAEETEKVFKKIKKLVDKKEIKKNFSHLVKSERVRGTKKNKMAGKYIFDTIKKYGYEVRFQNFTGFDEKLVDIYGNRNKNQKKGKALFKGRNIIVKRKKPDPKLKTVVFSAKYDSNKGSIGALDNVGGTVALMEMARILADTELSYNPEFVFFDSENLRRGSRFFVESLSKEEKEKIYGAVNINSIGNKKQRKQMFFASKKDKSGLKKQCEKIFSGILSDKSAETDTTTFLVEKIPAVCYFTYDLFDSSKEIKMEDYVREKDSSLVDMDMLVYDIEFITTYAYMLKVN